MIYGRTYATPRSRHRDILRNGSPNVCLVTLSPRELHAAVSRIRGEEDQFGESPRVCGFDGRIPSTSGGTEKYLFGEGFAEIRGLNTSMRDPTITIFGRSIPKLQHTVKKFGLPYS